MFKPYQIVIWWYTPVGKNPALGHPAFFVAPFFKVVVMTIPKRHSPAPGYSAIHSEPLPW